MLLHERRQQVAEVLPGPFATRTLRSRAIVTSLQRVRGPGQSLGVGRTEKTRPEPCALRCSSTAPPGNSSTTTLFTLAGVSVERIIIILVHGARPRTERSPTARPSAITLRDGSLQPPHPPHYCRFDPYLHTSAIHRIPGVRA